MINKNFYIKDHIHPKHLNNKIGKKLNVDSNLRSVDVIVARLRKKITSNSDTSFLKTVRGKGYMLISEYE